MSYKVALPGSFLESIKHLKKKYPHTNADAKTALQVLIENPFLGVVIQGGSGTRKLRVRNSNLTRGKSGGYRLIYLVDSANETLYPLLMYSKTEQEDVTQHEIKELVEQSKAQFKFP